VARGGQGPQPADRGVGVRIPDGAAGVRAAVDEEVTVARWREARRRPPSPAAARPSAPGSAAPALAVVASPPDLTIRAPPWPPRPPALTGQPDVCLPVTLPPGPPPSARPGSAGRGLPCMLLDVMATAAMSAACPGAEAERGQPGHAEQREGLADPGQAVLDGRAGFPPSAGCAASAYRSSAEEPGAAVRRVRTLASMTRCEQRGDSAMPCGTSAVPPMTPARPWHRAKTFAVGQRHASPAGRHMAMSFRAAPYRRRRRGRPAGPSPRGAAPRVPAPSVSGVARTETNGSRH